MKFSSSFAIVVALLPVLSQVSAVALPAQGVERRAFFRGKGNKGAGKTNTGGNNANTAATSAAANTAAAAAASGSAAAAAAAAASNTAAAAAASSSAAANTGDPQTSLTLDPRVISKGFEQDGQAVQEAGQVPSLTSSNNFINNCLNFPNLPLTNGQQITTGSCNTAPIGVIPSTDNMPSAKFVSPANLDTIQANKEFTVSMALNNLQAGNFVNAKTNYFAAPQQVNSGGQIIGHTHVVIEALESLTQTTPTNPKVFAFFKGINTPQQNGVVTADVTSGVPAGTYRMCSINSAANHQPVIVPVAQHGSLDDCVYFTASDNAAAVGANATASAATQGAAAVAAENTGTAGAGAAAAATTAATASATSAAAAGAAAKGKGKGGAATKGKNGKRSF